ncbi:hypothetical protein ABZ027_21150 [Streptomyces sp. NPDC006332]|uniref:hypothetical protein n=1 Tax=Streptomyces sp. NPDC006332 TaxID=3155456 RepID=UPI0033B8EBBA
MTRGQVIDERPVSRDSTARGISLRTGCFCNPGAGEAAFGVDPSALRGLSPSPDGTVDDYLAGLGLPSGGAVRVSLGLSSNQADVDTFLGFVTDTYRERTPGTDGLAPDRAADPRGPDGPGRGGLHRLRPATAHRRAAQAPSGPPLVGGAFRLSWKIR